MFSLYVFGPEFSNDSPIIVTSNNEFVLVAAGKLLVKNKLCFSCVIFDELDLPVATFMQK